MKALKYLIVLLLVLSCSNEMNTTEKKMSSKGNLDDEILSIFLFDNNTKEKKVSYIVPKDSNYFIIHNHEGGEKYEIESGKVFNDLLQTLRSKIDNSDSTEIIARSSYALIKNGVIKETNIINETSLESILVRKKMIGDYKYDWKNVCRVKDGFTKRICDQISTMYMVRNSEYRTDTIGSEFYFNSSISSYYNYKFKDAVTIDNIDSVNKNTIWYVNLKQICFDGRYYIITKNSSYQKIIIDIGYDFFKLIENKKKFKYFAGFNRLNLNDSVTEFCLYKNEVNVEKEGFVGFIELDLDTIALKKTLNFIKLK